MQVEITKIKIKLPAREIELTSDEARAVHAELGKLFAMDKTELQKFKDQYEKDLANVKNRPPYTIPIYPPQPIIIDRPVQWPYPWQTWCGDIPSYQVEICSTNITNSAPLGTMLCINLDR